MILTYESHHVCYNEQRHEYDDNDVEYEYNPYPCDCNEFIREEINDDIAQWQERNPAYGGIYIIEGEDMGWMRLSGSLIIDCSVEHDIDWVERLSIKGEFTQTWTIEDTTLRIRQSHHDAPTGESYTMRPASFLEYLTYILNEYNYENLKEILHDIKHDVEKHPNPEIPEFDCDTITTEERPYICSAHSDQLPGYEHLGYTEEEAREEYCEFFHALNELRTNHGEKKIFRVMKAASTVVSIDNPPEDEYELDRILSDAVTNETSGSNALHPPLVEVLEFAVENREVTDVTHSHSEYLRTWLGVKVV